MLERAETQEAIGLSQSRLSSTRPAEIGRLYPLDKHKNAQGRRALRSSPQETPPAAPAPAAAEPAPLLQKLMKDCATTGLPPAYLPKDDLTSTPTDGPKPA